MTVTSDQKSKKKITQIDTKRAFKEFILITD